MALVEQLGQYGSATVHEAMGRDGLMQPYLRPIYPEAKVAGTAVTVRCHPGDNLMIHAAIEVCRPGDVLVVVPEAESTDGMFGELLATSARAHGVLGLVIDAGVRDVTALTEMRFPVWSKAISARGTVKATPGAVNVPVVCGGVLVRAGDAIIADADGIVCVPREDVPAVLEKAAARTAKEDANRARLAAGELGVDIYGLRDKLKALGVTYVRHDEWEG
ncbi:MAG: 4-carboxy-4-hydroxy-2-oxoadipate aldolase/oxaloacetate decarboxylase [Thermoflavifilum sp.]|nr:4-carboxy-4-hydroxy-2-oxoadipate aldolase/oxaloacetate decarboxylase [Thermoflavifilum sp.]MCL6513825.1 4-carboxy-4-hydroxy-2-oxoadipate aldolase/oxaloacetate decarboxylase [Alicyclobacillus sp.]